MNCVMASNVVCYEGCVLMNVHPVLRGCVKPRQLQLPRSRPDGQPIESSQPERNSEAHHMLDDKVKIRCPKCTMIFRDRAQRVRNGYQVNCGHCNRLLTLSDE